MTDFVQLTNEFNGNLISTIYYQGLPCWIGKEVGKILGYSNLGKRLVSKITGEWKDEFVEGIDYVILRKKELVEFKQLFLNFPGSGPSNGCSGFEDARELCSRPVILLVRAS